MKGNLVKYSSCGISLSGYGELAFLLAGAAAHVV